MLVGQPSLACRKLRFMNYFLRALRDAVKSWPFLLAAFFCSAGVAGLWGANIAALFPIIEVTLNGESLQSWNGRRLTDAQQRVDDSLTESTDLTASLAAGSLADDEATQARSRIDTLSLNRRGDEAVVASNARWTARMLMPRR